MTGSRARSLVMGGVALGALYMVAFAILASGVFAHAPVRIAFAVTLDLTVTATLIAWWFGVSRKSSLCAEGRASTPGSRPCRCGGSRA
jgi:hypothetical protein